MKRSGSLSRASPANKLKFVSEKWYPGVAKVNFFKYHFSFGVMKVRLESLFLVGNQNWLFKIFHQKVREWTTLALWQGHTSAFVKFS